ncbi:MAG: hypothetical protein JOZ33_10185 [Acidobacteriaceae bacterium]|nr:hypothetical protein [Acidobacteriaceae bacterium]
MGRTQRTLWAVCILALFVTGSAAASVTVSPSSAQIKPGGQIQFTANGALDGLVVWSVTGAGCSGITCGSIDSSGLYIAPSSAPSPSTVTVTAVSIFDASQFGTAAVTIGNSTSVGISVSPTSVTLSVKGQQQFKATVTGTSNTGVNWTVTGIGCVAGSCGTITSAGLYTAPATIPNPALATVTATSVADPTKSASASVVIQSASSISVTVHPASVQVATGAQQQFTATVNGTTNQAVTWKLSGGGCSGSACGTISGTGLYTAPVSVPSPASVTVTATSVADPAQSGSASITVVAVPKLTISPANPQVKPQGQIQFSASGPQSGVVVWSVSGSGCAGISCGSINSSGLYTAPATQPTPNMVTVTAASLSNPAITGSTTVTIISNSVSVGVTPTSASVGVGGQQQFKATVTGSNNTAVTWTLSGTGCTGSLCGTISASGLYTAPPSAPNPPFVTVTATSVADPTKSASASVQVTQQIGISISPTSAQVVEGQTKQFTATVTGTSNTGVNWSVSGTGCSGSGCGTISNSGLYTAPDSIPAQVIVTATSQADLDVSASATVAIIQPVVVTVSPTTVIVALSTTQQFQVSVTGTANKAVTWSVSGSGCSGTACGTVNSAGLYTAPSVLPSPAIVVIKATSQAMTSASASATVSLVGSNNSKLAGQYAFYFNGYDSNGSYLEAGSLTADGNGHFTAGHEDVDSVGGSPASVAIGGTYTVNSDNRGTMIINSPLGTHTYKFALNALGTKGRFISFDQSGVRGSGVIEKQDTSAFDPSVFANGYVMALSGQDMSNGRVASLGLIFPDGTGFVSGSTMDVNDAGSTAPTFASFFGNYSVSSTGRGTLSLAIPGLGGGVLNFAFYVVSANEFLLVSTDPIANNGFILGGPAEIQNGTPFSSASFKGGSIFSMTGTNGTAPQDIVGRFNFDGVSNVTVNYDENSGGKITVAGVLTGAYDLELNGRGTLNLDTSTAAPLIWYVYATGPNQGFVMDASTAAAGLGEVFAQTIVPPFTNSDILGSYFFGPDDPVVQSTPLASGVSSFDGSSSNQGKGNVVGAQDSSNSTLSPNQILAGTYSVSGVSNNGRGAILRTSPTSANIAVWVVSPTEVIGLDLDSTATQPVVIHIEQ